MDTLRGLPLIVNHMPECKTVIRKALSINYIDCSPVSIQELSGFDTPPRRRRGKIIGPARRQRHRHSSARCRNAKIQKG